LDVTRGFPSRKPDKHVRTFVRACMRVHSKRVLEYNAKEKVRGVSAYLLLGTAKALTRARERLVTHVHAWITRYVCASMRLLSILYTHTSAVL